MGQLVNLSIVKKKKKEPATLSMIAILLICYISVSYVNVGHFYIFELVGQIKEAA